MKTWHCKLGCFAGKVCCLVKFDQRVDVEVDKELVSKEAIELCHWRNKFEI
jgi:hypothetical protein